MLVGFAGEENLALFRVFGVGEKDEDSFFLVDAAEVE